MHGAIRGHDRSTRYMPIVREEEHTCIKPDNEEESLEASRSPRGRLLIEEPSSTSETEASPPEGRLKVRETLKLSFEFCILWVGAYPNLHETRLILNSFLYVRRFYDRRTVSNQTIRQTISWQLASNILRSPAQPS